MIQPSFVVRKFAIGQRTIARGAEAFADNRSKISDGNKFASKSIRLLVAAMLITDMGLRTAMSQTAIAPLTNLLGRMADQSGKPMPHVEIIVRDPSGKIIIRLRTNEIGRYCVSELAPGQYTLTHNPDRPAFMGQTVVANLPREGLYVDWLVSTNSAVAIATTLREFPGCSDYLAGGSLLERIFGAVSGDTLAAGSILGGIGALAGAGASGGGKNRSVASPSQ